MGRHARFIGRVTGIETRDVKYGYEPGTNFAVPAQPGLNVTIHPLYHRTIVILFYMSLFTTVKSRDRSQSSSVLVGLKF